MEIINIKVKFILDGTLVSGSTLERWETLISDTVCSIGNIQSIYLHFVFHLRWIYAFDLHYHVPS